MTGYDVKVRDSYPLQTEQTFPCDGTLEDAIALAHKKHKRTHRYTRVCPRGEACTLYRVQAGHGMYMSAIPLNDGGKDDI